MKWDACKFEDVVDFFDHMRIPVSTLKREEIQGGYPYYGAQGVIDYVNDYIFDGEYVLIAEDGANLITRNQPIAQMATGQFWVNNHAHVVRAKKGVSTNYFINTLINSMNLTGYVTGAAQPKLSQKNLRIVEINMPSFAEQVRITSILSTYDDLIENNRRRIQLLEQAARLLYKEWFVHLRFPGHQQATITNGVPEGWERKALGELSEIKGGKQFGDNELDDSWKIPVFGGNGIQGYSQKRTHSEFLIVFGRVGANCGSIHWSYDGAWVNNNASSIVPFTNNEIILQHLLDYNFTHLRKGAAQPFISNGILSAVKLLVPTEALAYEFCSIIKNLRHQQQLLNRQVRFLVNARDLLLPRLMDGKVST